MKKSTGLFEYLMISPTALVLTVLSLFPLIFIIYYSFTDYYYLSLSDPKNIGIDNYIKLFSDRYFLQALYNTFIFTVVAVITEVFLGLMVAVLIDSIVKRQKFFRTVSLLPTLLPPVTVALVWQIMLANNDGLFNSILNILGFAGYNFLGEIDTAFWCILLIDIWQYSPFAFLLMYASLQGVPKGQYEAAAVDGANAFQRFIYITLPNISNGIALVAILRMIDSFRLFDKVNVLTKGGPANSTATISQYIYQNGVSSLRVGYASTASVVMTVMVLAMASIYIYRSFKTKKL